jgi:hypothetical protein
MFIAGIALLFFSSVRSDIRHISLLTELERLGPSQSINITPRRGWNFQMRFEKVSSRRHVGFNRLRNLANGGETG